MISTKKSKHIEAAPSRSLIRATKFYSYSPSMFLIAFSNTMSGIEMIFQRIKYVNTYFLIEEDIEILREIYGNITNKKVTKFVINHAPFHEVEDFFIYVEIIDLCIKEFDILKEMGNLDTTNILIYIKAAIDYKAEVRANCGYLHHTGILKPHRYITEIAAMKFTPIIKPYVDKMKKRIAKEVLLMERFDK